MNHREYIKIAPGSRCAVLLIHGIVGTPNHFRFLLPLIPEDWSVYNLLLDGHGHGVKEFGAASMKKWKAQVTARVDEILARHERVVIAAHSMGTLFAIQEAIRQPDKIAQLFLLAVPLRPFVRPIAAVSALKLALGIARPDDAVAMAMQNAGGVRLDSNIFGYIPWIPRFLELLAECRRTRKMLPRLTVPCQTYQSRHDELVSGASNRYLQGHSAITNTILPHSGHFAYEGEDEALLMKRFREIIEKS